MRNARGWVSTRSEYVTPTNGWAVCHVVDEVAEGGAVVSRAAASSARRFMVEVYDFC